MKQLDWSFLYRKKPIETEDDSNNEGDKLPRVLTVFDLTALGVGTTLGSGIYVLAGTVIKTVAGPSLVLSFLIASIVSIIAALCYSELGARVPKTGSAYAYTYVCVGEFMAFIIGWNLMAEYAIGSAGVTRAFSNYLDSLIDNRIQNFFRENVPMHIKDLSAYPDFFAFGFAILITAIVSMGVKESAMMNKVFTGLNLSVILFVIVFGAAKSDIHNWKIREDELPTNWSMNVSRPCNTTETCGTGGFFPFGFAGTLAGTAKCFLAFIGFDSISTTGGEVVNPQRSIPLSIILSLLICCCVYCGVSTVLSLMVPYYMIDKDAPMPDAFRQVHWDWARYLVASGALISLSTCLLSAMFALSRVLYAIADDGLAFRFLAKIDKKFKTPFIATWACGILAGFLAMIFELQELVNMTSIGTLLAYSLVAISVLILRYEAPADSTMILKLNDPFFDNDSDGQSLINLDNDDDSFIQRLFNPTPILPTAKISRLAYTCIGVIVVSLFGICIMIVEGGHRVSQPAKNPLFFTAFIILIYIVLVFVLILTRQPQNRLSKTFQMPFVPIFPLLSVFVNFYLIMVLPTATWIRFAVWLAIGLLMYFTYGIRNSGVLLNKKKNVN